MADNSIEVLWTRPVADLLDALIFVEVRLAAAAHEFGQIPAVVVDDVVEVPGPEGPRGDTPAAGRYEGFDLEGVSGREQVDEGLHVFAVGAGDIAEDDDSGFEGWS